MPAWKWAGNVQIKVYWPGVVGALNSTSPDLRGPRMSTLAIISAARSAGI